MEACNEFYSSNTCKQCIFPLSCQEMYKYIDSKHMMDLLIYVYGGTMYSSKVVNLDASYIRCDMHISISARNIHPKRVFEQEQISCCKMILSWCKIHKDQNSVDINNAFLSMHYILSIITSPVTFRHVLHDMHLYLHSQ